MAQAARLNLRMQKEVKLLLTDPPPGASFPHLSPTSDLSSFSLAAIDAQIQGPEGTVYEKGVFKIKIQIPERYPFQPPIVTFGTPIYHPNIDTGGRICLDILNLPPKGAWQPSLNISTVLTSIGLLLSEPNPDDGLMCEASKEYKYNKQVFDQKARSMTEKYAKSDASGSNTRESDMGMNEVPSDLISQSRVQEPKQDSKSKHHDQIPHNPLDHDYHKPAAISSKKLCLSGKNLQHEPLDSTKITGSQNGKLPEIQKDFIDGSCQSRIQEPNQDSKRKNHDQILHNPPDHDYYMPAAISSKKLCLSGKILQHEPLDSTKITGSEKGKLLENKKDSIDGSCQSRVQEPNQDSKSKHHDQIPHSPLDHDYHIPAAISSKKLCLSGKNLEHEPLDSTKITGSQKGKLLENKKDSIDGSCQSKIQEPNQGSKSKNHDQIPHNPPDHDYHLPAAISSKKLCLSGKNLQHQLLDSTKLTDPQKGNLLKVQKDSIDGSFSTNPKRKKLGLTGKKPSLGFLGQPQNQENNNKGNTMSKVPQDDEFHKIKPTKLPRKPLQVLEDTNNQNMTEYSTRTAFKHEGQHGKRFEECIKEEEGFSDSEGVIVLDSESSEEETTGSLISRRLIARKRVLGKC